MFEGVTKIRSVGINKIKHAVPFVKTLLTPLKQSRFFNASEKVHTIYKLYFPTQEKNTIYLKKVKR